MTDPQHNVPPLFSFVLPAHNEEENLRRMAERLIAVGEGLAEPFELLWVDDGSTDRTPALLEELRQADPRIRVLHFSRNFGHMAALTAGLEAARATGAVICLDSDGQHPPELIPELVRRWRQGADVVQTLRQDSIREGWFKRRTSRAFYRFFNWLGEIDLPAGAADFRLLDRQVVDALNALPERVRFVRGLVRWLGFRQEFLPYQPEARWAGTTKYSLVKMLRLAFNGLTSFSVRPLRLSFLLALLVALAAGCYGLFVLYSYFVGAPLALGWASLLLTVMALGAAQLLAIGIASEYLARMFLEQKRRPVYVLREERPRGSGLAAPAAPVDPEDAVP